MKLKIVFLVFAFWANSLVAQEIVNYTSLWKKQPIELQAELHFPKNGQAPYPVIFALHSSGPDIPLAKINGKTDIYAEAIKQAALSRGYAVVMMETFEKRNVTNLWSNLSQISSHVSKLDAHRLAKVLEKDARLNRNNFFFTGHSYGGTVGKDLAHGVNGDSMFNAIVASAPGCHIVRDTEFNTPLKIIIGDNDQTVSHIPCTKLSGRAEVEVVKGMSHSFSTHGDQYTSSGENMLACSDKVFVRETNQTFKYQGTEIDSSEYRKMCIRKGTYGRGARDKLQYVVDSTITYFDKHLK